MLSAFLDTNFTKLHEWNRANQPIRENRELAGTHYRFTDQPPPLKFVVTPISE